MMYKLTLVLFAYLSFVLPFLAGAVPVPDKVDERETSTTFYGRATWYTPGLGACGATSDKTALVVAVSSDIFQQDLCWKYVKIEDADNGKSVTAQIVDKCPGCNGYSLDLSKAAFQVLASPSQGVIKDIAWQYV